jgi:hypothetical protein
MLVFVLNFLCILDFLRVCLLKPVAISSSLSSIKELDDEEHFPFEEGESDMMGLFLPPKDCNLLRYEFSWGSWISNFPSYQMSSLLFIFFSFIFFIFGYSDGGLLIIEEVAPEEEKKN